MDNIIDFIKNEKTYKGNTIYIKFGTKEDDYLFNKGIDEDILQMFLSKLLKNYNYKEYSNMSYSTNKKKLIVNEKENICIEKIIKDYSIYENYYIEYVDEKKIPEIMFPCKKHYDYINKNSIISIIIDDLTVNFINNKYIEIKIINNSYIDVSLEKLSDILEEYLNY